MAGRGGGRTELTVAARRALSTGAAMTRFVGAEAPTMVLLAIQSGSWFCARLAASSASCLALCAACAAGSSISTWTLVARAPPDATARPSSMITLLSGLC